MFYMPIILGSVRAGRLSPRAAKFIRGRLQETGKVECEILDLKQYNFPIMEERLKNLEKPPEGLREFAGEIRRADAIVIVTPEYNNSFPGALKNCLDYLLPEFRRKPVGIVSVSGGPFGGINALAQLRIVLLMMGAIPIPIRLPIIRVEETLDEEGRPLDPVYEKSAAAFIDELLWLTEAISVKRDFAK